MNILHKIILYILFSQTISFGQQDKIIIVNYNNKDYLISAYLREGMYYLSVEDLCRIFPLTYSFNPVLKKIEIKNNKYIFKIYARNPFIYQEDITSGDTFIYQISTSTYFFNNKLFIPLKYSLDLLEKILVAKIDFKEPNKLFILEQLLDDLVDKKSPFINYDVIAMSIDEKANGTMIRLRSKKKITSYQSSFEKNTLRFLFRKVKGDTVKLKFVGTRGVVKSISSKNLENDLEIKIIVGPEYTNSEVFNIENSDDILITIHNKLFKKDESLTKKQKWKFDVIVIDPGHGGKDPGAIGINGVKEKDITLSISKYLGKLIQEKMKDVKVVYTRNSDVFVELYKRGKIANENNGKLFISIHCNASINKSNDATGFEVYLLRPGKTKEAIAIAELENSVIEYEEDPNRYQKLTDENFILVSMAQSAYMRFSEKFAELLDKQFARHKFLPSRGVKQAGFYVLVGASMPNVLIETGFLSNKNDALYLSSKKGQQEIAERIFNAIIEYQNFYQSEIDLN